MSGLHRDVRVPPLVGSGEEPDVRRDDGAGEFPRHHSLRRHLDQHPWVGRLTRTGATIRPRTQTTRLLLARTDLDPGRRTPVRAHFCESSPALHPVINFVRRRD